VYPATIVGIPPTEDFYIGGASVKWFLPIFKMNFPEIVDIALSAEGVFHNLVLLCHGQNSLRHNDDLFPPSSCRHPCGTPFPERSSALEGDVCLAGGFRAIALGA
jgi:hypothetical protein